MPTPQAALGSRPIHRHAVCLRVATLVAIAALLALPASATTYYVNKGKSNASDTNDGSAVTPWKTIQKAANSVGPGDTVIVVAATYNERVTISASGSSGNPITFKPNNPRAASTQGFVINGDYIRVIGFEIRNTGNLRGIQLSGSNIDIIDNGFYQIRNAAIYCRVDNLTSTAGWPTNLYIARNYIYRSQVGFVLRGVDCVVENNEIDQVVQYQFFDADYATFFGRNLIIRRNWLHGTNLADLCPDGYFGPRDSSICAHTDGFQTFNSNGEIAENITIECNIVQNFHQGIIMQDNSGSGSVRDIFIHNNLFLGQLEPRFSSWGVLASGVINVDIQHNVFHNIGTAIGFKRLNQQTSGNAKNNIIYKCGNTYVLDDGQTTGPLSFSRNMVFETTKRTPVSGDINDVDPRFSNPTLYLGPDGRPFTTDDGFRIQESSPALNGAFSGSVSNDIFGNSRPWGGNPDIGAHEKVTNEDTDGDGVPDFIEISLGTDPDDPNGFPILPLGALTPLLSAIVIAGGILLSISARRS